MRALCSRLPPPRAMAASPCLPTHTRCPCSLSGLLSHWGLPSLPKAKSQALSGEQSSTGWGYLSHLICGQHVTVYKALPPSITDTFYSNTGQLGVIIPKFRREDLTSENEESSSPKGTGCKAWRWGQSGELPTCLLDTETSLPSQALPTPEGPRPRA